MSEERTYTRFSRRPNMVSISDLPQPLDVAPWWRRLFAFIIDWALLAILSFGLIIAAGNLLVGLGWLSLLLGWGMGTLYFGLLDGQPGRGQTLGKRIMGIRVVTAEEKSLGVIAALGRAGLLSFMVTGSGWLPGVQAISITLRLITLVLAVVTAYTFLLNEHTKQTPYDLLAGAYVVIAANTGGLTRYPPRFQAINALVPLGLSVLLIGIGMVGWQTALVGSSPTARQLAPIAELRPAIMGVPSVQAVTFGHEERGSLTPDGINSPTQPGTRTILTVTVDVTTNCRSEAACGAIARDVADLIQNTLPAEAAPDAIDVTVRSGPQLGWLTLSNSVMVTERTR